jgi:uncharacterized damage-inducible protein DinB
MADRKQAIADYMRQSHDATWPVLSSLSEADRGLPVFGDGDAPWSIGDLVAHLADAESGILGQVQRLLAGKETVPQDFDLSRWNRSAVRRNKSRTYEDLLDHIRKAHLEALKTLEATEAASLELTGRHASGDILTVEGFFRRIADHRRDHTRDIQQALAGVPRST